MDPMKKVSLGTYPTALERLDHLTRAVGKGTIYIKRDDTTGPAFGGNKTRKLEYLLCDALEQGCTTVLTVGGPQTNHGRITAAAARKLGLKAVLVLSGHAPKELSGNLVLDAMMGTELVFDEGHPDQAVQETIARYERAGEKVYNICMGGSDSLGFLGYFHAVPEILRQIESLEKKPKWLICAAGSLGTYSGLYAGAAWFHAPFQVIGIPVFPEVDGIVHRAAELIRESSARYTLGISASEEDLHILEGPADAPYFGLGYNVPDAWTRAAVFQLAQTEGIFLDPTYTGKAFRGMLHLMETGVIGKDEDVIFLHTGGATGLWSKEHLDAMQQELWANSAPLYQ